MPRGLVAAPLPARPGGAPPNPNPRLPLPPCPQRPDRRPLNSQGKYDPPEILKGGLLLLLPPLPNSQRWAADGDSNDRGGAGGARPSRAVCTGGRRPGVGELIPCY